MSPDVVTPPLARHRLAEAVPVGPVPSVLGAALRQPLCLPHGVRSELVNRGPAGRPVGRAPGGIPPPVSPVGSHSAPGTGGRCGRGSAPLGGPGARQPRAGASASPGPFRARSLPAALRTGQPPRRPRSLSPSGSGARAGRVAGEVAYRGRIEPLYSRQRAARGGTPRPRAPRLAPRRIRTTGPGTSPPNRRSHHADISSRPRRAAASALGVRTGRGTRMPQSVQTGPEDGAWSRP